MLSPEGGSSESGLHERHSSSAHGQQAAGQGWPWEEKSVSERQCPGKAPQRGFIWGSVWGLEAGQGAMAGALFSSAWPRGLGGQQTSCCCCCDIPPSAQDRHLGLRAGQGARLPSACLELAASERQWAPAGAVAAGGGLGGGSLTWAACQASGCHGEAGFWP